MVVEISVRSFHLNLQKCRECTQGRICQDCYEGDNKRERICNELDVLLGI